MKRYLSLTFVMLPQQKIALEKLAKLEGESISVTLRRLIVNAAKSHGFWTPSEMPTAQITTKVE